jgi:hypothetical protein
MTFHRGDVVLVPFPFSDLSTTKVRPAVVVSSALYHSTEPDILPAALTSQVTAATGPFDYLLQDWRSANLRFPSRAYPSLPIPKYNAPAASSTRASRSSRSRGTHSGVACERSRPQP